MPSQRDVAKRALVTLLLAMAVTYHVTLSNINRDSPDLAVLAAYRQVIKKAHPDRGGQVADAQMLTAAREKWDLANQRNGRPPKKKARCVHAVRDRVVHSQYSPQSSLERAFLLCCLPPAQQQTHTESQRMNKNKCNTPSRTTSP